MRWFKHMTAAGSDEKITKLIDIAGLEGLGFYWRMVEIIASQISEATEKCEVTYSLPTLSRLTYSHHHKVSNLLGKLGVTGLMVVSKSELHGVVNYTISCPNILKYRDEWTSRKPKTREQLPSNSRATPDGIQSTDTDTDTDKKKTTTALKKEPEFHPDFLSFWEAYPKGKRGNQQTMFGLWKKNHGNAKPKELLRALESHVAQAKESKYVKTMKNFLNDNWEQWLSLAESKPQAAMPHRIKNTFED